MTYHGKTFLEARRTTSYEFSYLKRKYSLERQVSMQDIHVLAWKINEAQATKKVGKDYKAVFPTFKDFYDSEEEYLKAMYGDVYRYEKEREKEDMANTNRLLHKNLRKERDLVDIEEQNRRIEEVLNKST